MENKYSEQKIRPAGGRRSPRASELRSQAADKLLRMLHNKRPKKSRSNRKMLEFARLGQEDKVKFLKEKLYRLYEQQLRACEEGMETDLIDYKIDQLEGEIKEIQVEMWG